MDFPKAYHSSVYDTYPPMYASSRGILARIKSETEETWLQEDKLLLLL